MQEISSNRFATYRYVALLALFTLAPVAAFGDASHCPADSTSLECRLLGFLHWLEAAAFVLVILLLIVIGFAVYLVRKNRLSRKGGR